MRVFLAALLLAGALSACVPVLPGPWRVAAQAATERCIASHYGVGDGYGGKRTASGAIMRPGAMTAAMRKPQPLGSRVRVTNTRNGQSVVVLINDRGPFVHGRCIDLSYGAARAIGIAGIGPVSIAQVR